MTIKTEPETKPAIPAPAPPPAPEEEPVLELEELAPKRASVLFRTAEERAAGESPKRYEVKTPEEFGVEDEQLYRSELRDYNELMLKQNLNKAERARLVQRLNQLFTKVLIAPSEIKAHFNDRQRQQVIALFTTALLTADAAAIENAMPAQLAQRLTSEN